jgi:hypothetical protein
MRENMKFHGHRAVDGDHDEDNMKFHGHRAADGDHDQDNMKSHDHSAADGDHDEQVFATTFTALNNSGVKGAAALVYDPDSHNLTVEIDASGLTPGQVHPAHIHGFPDNMDATSPTLAQDADHDGFVELAEGLTTYGPILLNLTSPPTQPAAVGDGTFAGMANVPDFPNADANGDVHFRQTYHFEPNDPAAQSLLATIEQFDHKEIVLHGENVAAGEGAGTGGEVDGTAGYKAVLPVASGEIHDVTGHEANKIVADLQHDTHTGDHSLSDFLLGHA